MQDLFTNPFPLGGKIKLSVAGVSENGRKKWFPLTRKSVSTSKNKVIFQELKKESDQIKEYCFKLTENRFPLAGIMRICLKVQ